MDTTSHSRISVLPTSAVGRTVLVALGLGALVGAGFGLGLLSTPAQAAKAEDISAPAAAPAPLDPLLAIDDSLERTPTVAEPSPTPAAPLAPTELGEPNLDGDPGAAQPAASDAAKTAGATAADGKFYVQVASFRGLDGAEARARALSAHGQRADTFEEGRWHSVRLGPFDTRGEAEKQRLALSLNERRDAFVLPRSNGLYHVQVASFESQDVAERIAKGYADAGHSTKVTRVRMAGKYWHCVRIGPFDTREEALAYQKLMPEKAGIEARVIPFDSTDT